MKLFSNTELSFFNFYSVNLQKNQNCLRIVYVKCHKELNIPTILP